MLNAAELDKVSVSVSVLDTLQQSQIGPMQDSNGSQSPLPHTLEPRVDECSFEVQSTVPGWSPGLFE